MECITIKDVARVCGVGVSTVSRAINNHPDINPETKEMIMQVIKENNYVPNNSARNLKRSDARAIAILIKGISNPFFNSMIKFFEEEIQKKKYSLVLQHVDEWQDETEVAERNYIFGRYCLSFTRSVKKDSSTFCFKYGKPFGERIQK